MSKWVSRAIVAVAVLGAVACVGLAAIGGAYYWQRVQTQGANAARTELPTLARQQVPMVLGFDYQTIERSRLAAYDFMTPSFRQQYEASVSSKVVPEAKQSRVVSDVSVVGAGPLSGGLNSGSVLVFMNRVITFNDPAKKQDPVYEGSRLRVDYRKIDGRWLMNDIQPI
jgi:Mce-associated membrane protein